MLKQIKTLSILELRNLYGINVFRFSTDKKARRKTIALTFAGIFLILLLFFYVIGLSYGLVQLGLKNVIPAYLIAIASIIIFFFDIFKAGSFIFKRNGYDMLCSLPLSQTAIVISRFLRMYAENLLVTLAILLPGLAVYVWADIPALSFYILGILTILFLPLAPMVTAAIIGAVITGISARMKHQSLIEAALSILVIIAVLLASSRLSAIEDTITPDMLKELSSTVFSLLEKLYPPAVWLGTAVITGDFLRCLLCIGFFILLFAVAAMIIAINFHGICHRLYSVSARHDYQLKNLKRGSVLLSLYKREIKRYFSSGVYVTNTIIGPVMGTIFSGMLLFTDVNQITQILPISIHITACMPFLLAGIFCIMTTTSVSISMEGRNWWIVKSLPLETKTILDSKLLMNLSLILPFYVVSQILLVPALKPDMTDMLWQLLIPTILILFSCVYGITINLHFPVLDWESETGVVKQSLSSLLGGMGGFILSLVCMIPAALLPEVWLTPFRFIFCIFISVLTLFLYRKNNTFSLQEI